uniref:Uncharacterized protein n=1 Tax=Peronospora matthiolae TaxID=2874970 RepID=A0AAV1U1C5_9STRA
MASPTHLFTSPISSEGSIMLLSPDRDPSPGSPITKDTLQRSQIGLGLHVI